MDKTTFTSAESQVVEVSLRDAIVKLGDWYRYLYNKWKIVLTVCILGAICGASYAYIKGPVYTAECTFVLEDNSGGGSLGQYAGLASMVGIDLGSRGSNGIFQGDNIIELYKSRTMIQRTLLSKVFFDGNQDFLINRYLSNQGGLLRKANVSFNLSEEKLSLQQDSVLGIVVNDIRKNHLQVSKPDKKLNIVSVKVNSEDEAFAKVFTEQIVRNVNDFYVQTKTKKALENFNILQRQADSVRKVLNASIGSAAAAIDVNPNANSAMQMLKVPSQRRQVDVQASSAIYSEIVKNLEISKISLRQETPLIQVVDSPILPLNKVTVNPYLMTFLGCGLAALCAILLLSIGYLVRQLKVANV